MDDYQEGDLGPRAGLEASLTNNVREGGRGGEGDERRGKSGSVCLSA